MFVSQLQHRTNRELFLPDSPTRTSVSLVVKFFKSTGISLKIYCWVEVRAGVPDSWPLVEPLDLSAEVFPQRIILWALFSEFLCCSSCIQKMTNGLIM